eukprot:586868-Lingulodinium_polyedra.AAC.1
MSSSSTGRAQSCPLGSGRSASAVNGNQMVARCGLLVCFALAKLATWTSEQPSTSLMPLRPCMDFIRGQARRRSWAQ